MGEFEFKTRWGEFVWARFRVQAIGQKRVCNNGSYHYTDIEGVKELAIIGAIITLILRE